MPLPQALSRLLDAAQNARVVFELVIEPVLVRPWRLPRTVATAAGSNESDNDKTDIY
jgi:hypothetical protein